MKKILILIMIVSLLLTACGRVDDNCLKEVAKLKCDLNNKSLQVFYTQDMIQDYSFRCVDNLGNADRDFKFFSVVEKDKCLN